MKKLALPLAMLLLFALTACGGGDAQLKKLSGVWGVDVKASLDLDESMKDLSPEEKEFAAGMAGMILSAMSMEFDVEKKKVTVAFGVEKRTTDFTVESAQGKNIVLKSDGDLLNIEFKDDNTVIFGDSKQQLVFIRKK